MMRAVVTLHVMMKSGPSTLSVHTSSCMQTEVGSPTKSPVQMVPGNLVHEILLR